MVPELFEIKLVSDARAEGEGDKSLSYWKQAHTEVFRRECREDFDMEFSEDMDCVCEYFEVVYQK